MVAFIGLMFFMYLLFSFFGARATPASAKRAVPAGFGNQRREHDDREGPAN